ncbi:MAG: T9SS type A sorting domain-containing protein [Candidatus Electryonea clarkiae]|nr:T9SS type A sorting domain-containing protein [Candidatus Electryonea clarkiae]MDP8287297.1 T9SS type A sorting domain-containing protein [Candidatus Electryonea clarkiae]
MITISIDSLFSGTKFRLLLPAILLLFILHSSIAQAYTWTNTGPFGGDIYSLEAASWDNDIIYAGTYESGMWRYNPDDETWEEINDSLPWLINQNTGWEMVGIHSEIYTIYTHPLEEDKVWIGVRNTGLLISENGGNSWREPDDIPITYAAFFTISAREDDPEILFATSSNLAFMSEDGGDSWDIIIREIDGAPVAFVPGNPNHLYISKYESNDGGDTWNEFGEYPFEGVTETLGLTVDPTDTNRIYALVFPHSDQVGRILRSTDQGANWQIIRRLTAFPGYKNVLQINQSGHIFVENNYRGIIEKSTDHGENWSQLNWTSGQEWLVGSSWEIIMDIPTDENEILYFGTNWGVHQSDDGGENVANFSTGMVASNVHNIFIPIAQPNYVVAFSSELWISSDYGRIWSGVTGSEARGAIAIAGTDSLTIYTFQRNREDLLIVRKSTNGGESWNVVSNINFHALWHLSDTEVHPFNPDTLWASFTYSDTMKIIRSLNGGEEWQQVFICTSQDRSYAGKIYVDPEEPDHIYIVGVAIHRSTDAGTTWEEIQCPDNYLRDMVVNHENSEAFIIKTDMNLYISEDSGESWDNYDSGLPHNSGSGWGYLGIVRGNPDLFLYLKPGNGLFYRSADDYEWELVNMPDRAMIISMATGEDGLTAIGTSGRGVFVTDIYDYIPDQNTNLIPKEFIVSNPYPNPFNSEIKFDMYLPTRAFVKIEIFDILGRKVESINESEMLAGQHIVSWNAKNYSSGIYFIKTSTDIGVRIRKTILLP